jgi:UDP-N-acetylglucosamine--N-acetylmuramyl-(pentapeptide) pyrophosphoryl-undecaprenol N-acetylglucosamine transferase
LEKIKEAYRQMGLSATVCDFIDDMAPIYRGARLAVCRCGGLTLSELSIMGLPAIMIPFPLAADDHQMKNGRYVEAHGGGWIIPDDRLNPERLALEIKKRFFDDGALELASSRIFELQLGKGSQRIAEEILGV